MCYIVCCGTHMLAVHAVMYGGVDIYYMHTVCN